MVHPVGFEPTHLAAPEPESGVYANFTTGASGHSISKSVCRCQTRQSWHGVTQRRSSPLKRRAANKPDSVHPLAGTPIIHLSNQPGTLVRRKGRHPTGSRSVPYLILLRGGFALRRALSRPAGGLLHRPFTMTRRKPVTRNSQLSTSNS